MPLALCLAVPPAGPSWASEKASWDGVAYLPGSGGSILRYDLAAGAWLDPLPAPVPAPSHPHRLEMGADESGLYVRYVDRILRFGHDGSGPTTLWQGAPDSMGIDGPWLFVLDGNVLRTLDKSDGAVAFELPLEAQARSLVVAPGAARVALGSLSGMWTLAYGGDGSLGAPTVADDAVPSTLSPVVFPDGRRVLDLSGHVLDAADDLAYLGSAPIRLVDATFMGDVLVANQLHLSTGSAGTNFVAAFEDGTFRELGRLGPIGVSSTLFSHAGRLFVFDRSEQPPSVQSLELSELRAPALSQPNMDAFATSAAVTAGGIVYLGTSYPPALLRWSLKEGRYLEAVALREAAQAIVYDASTDTLYVSYPNRPITRIEDPSGSTPRETPFAVLPWLSASVVSSRGRVFAATTFFGSLGLLSSYGPDGDAVGFPEVPLIYAQVAASEATERLFQGVPGGPVASFRVEADGTISDIVEHPGPLPYGSHLLPDASGSLLFDGKWVRNARTLAVASSGLEGEGDFDHAGWLGDRLVTSERVSGRLGLRVYAPPYEVPELELWDSGSTSALLPFEGGLLHVRARYLLGSMSRTFTMLALDGDADSDGVPDGADAFPLDPTESRDQDGDTYGDAHQDAFPDDFLHQSDQDGDRIPDGLDLHPLEPEVIAGPMLLKARHRPRRSIHGQEIPTSLHLFTDGTYRLCFDVSPDSSLLDGCLPRASWIEDRDRPRRLTLRPHAGVLAPLRDRAEAELEVALRRRRGSQVDVDLAFRLERSRLQAKVNRAGDRVRLKLKLPYEATSDELPRGRLRGTLRARGEVESLAR